ncbi:exodeoxyribonuclease VII large subunit [Motiliproteus sediminis]|uniref:exodeoxyribonuclease VII large subunit n=1 Tax=Motiliproteus sediminis TaxID=1468178 RepID=UPI001AEFF970|nr:exodeoxyribonuclease VII large subunit [Motiliproteus sediminis]
MGSLLVSSPPAKILKVSQLNLLARQLLEDSFPLVTVEGEISNFVRPSSGHWYFTLKDDSAQVRCALFRNRNQFLKYRPANGDLVRLRARVSLYEGRGEFQLIGDYLEEAGSGALQAAFEALKAKLNAEGLFDPTHKRVLPSLPRAIGVITSPTGAAVRDIITVLKRRFPAIEVYLYPAAVQGAEAATQLRAALELAVRDNRCDALIIGRGGGSVEDLWPFNDEALARAIHACPLPIVSAVGHETDFSICDFVADQRAATPSAAAELLSPDRQQWLRRLDDLQYRLQRQQQRQIHEIHLRLRALASRLRHPGQRLQQQAQQLDRLELRLQAALRQSLNRSALRLSHTQERLALQNPAQRLRQLSIGLQQLQQRLNHSCQRRLERLGARLGENARALHAVSPLATLERGYAIVSNDQQQLITHVDQANIGQRVNARLASGSLQCEVIAIETADQ